MKTLIKEINNVTGEGVSFSLTQKASLNEGISADQWFVSWDKIGRALFGDQYYATESVAELKVKRGEQKIDKELQKKMQTLMYALTKNAAMDSYKEFREGLDISDNEYADIKRIWKEKLGIEPYI